MCLINCSRADMIENPKVRKVLNEVASWRSNVWVWIKNLLLPLLGSIQGVRCIRSIFGEEC